MQTATAGTPVRFHPLSTLHLNEHFDREYNPIWRCGYEEVQDKEKDKMDRRDFSEGGREL
jgi:hypothetical protein